MSKVITISIPEYKADKKPDCLAIGLRLDQLLEKHFLGKDVVLRCIGGQDHPNKTLDELADIVLKTGTDKYDPDRKGQGYEAGSNQDEHIDFFGTETKVQPSTDIFTLELLDDFYYGSQGDRGYPIRIDLVIVYDAAKLTKVEHLYGEAVEESDGFVFKDPGKKHDTLMGVIKILS